MYPQYHQMTLEDYDFPYGKLDPENEWVKLANLVPWSEAEAEYAKQFVNNGLSGYEGVYQQMSIRNIHNGRI